jgi:hypothetical protein
VQHKAQKELALLAERDRLSRFVAEREREERVKEKRRKKYLESQVNLICL